MKTYEVHATVDISRRVTVQDSTPEQEQREAVLAAETMHDLKGWTLADSEIGERLNVQSAEPV